MIDVSHIVVFCQPEFVRRLFASSAGPARPRR